MNRKERNILSLLVHLSLAIVIGFIFWYELRLTFTLPKVVGPVEITVLAVWSYAISGFLKCAKVAITGGRYNKIQEKRKTILDDENSLLYAYMDSAIRGVVIEELVFRVMPYILILGFGLFMSSGQHQIVSQIIAMGASSVWVALHRDRIVQVAPMGVVFYLFLVNGLIIESVLVHLFYNTLAFASIIINNVEN